jgi:hypothetical protein
LPGPQSVQAALPVIGLYLPATQLVQVPPFVPVNPPLQEQLEAALLPAGESESGLHGKHVLLDVCPDPAEYLPAPQSSQLPLPVAGLYLPPTHSKHAPPSGPVVPAMHTHFEAAPLPAGAFEFAGHTEQALPCT